MMMGQKLMYMASLAILFAGLIVSPTSAIEPGGCVNVTSCSDCLALAPNCSWFVCQLDSSHCDNATGGAAEGCQLLDPPECGDPDPDTTTTDAPTSTTEFPTTPEPTEPPTSTTEQPTETPTETPTTTPTEPPTEPPTSTTEQPTDTPPTPTVTPTNPTDPTTDTPITTVGPTGAPVPPDPTPGPGPAPTAAPRTGGFSFGSFVGGMVFCVVIVAGGFIGLKIYRRRQAMTGRYNNL